MTTIRVSALFKHPLKSARSIPVEELELDEFGAVDDRRWMLMDEHGIAVTQREAPMLALIWPKLIGDDLELHSADLSPMRVLKSQLSTAVREGMVHDDAVHVHDAGDEASAWCSAHVGMACRLVHVSASSPRVLHPKYAGDVSPFGRRVALSDGAPLLLLGESSISLMNAALVEQGEPVLGVERFRPNVLLAGTTPHEEDTWHSVNIGDMHLGVGTPCPRCMITTTDQQTAERGLEPLRTLATYRKQGSGVMFGMNATNEKPGVIRLGDVVTVHALKSNAQ